MNPVKIAAIPTIPNSSGYNNLARIIITMNWKACEINCEIPVHNTPEAVDF
jgi:hypothetical protein